MKLLEMKSISFEKKNKDIFLDDSYNSEICVVPSLKSVCISTTGTPKILLGTIDVGSQSSLNIRHKDFDVDVGLSCTACGTIVGIPLLNIKGFYKERESIEYDNVVSQSVACSNR